MLAVLGGMVGYVLTVVAWKALAGIAPVKVPRLGTAHADWRILVFSLAVALANGVLFGMLPAYRAGWMRANAYQDLRSHSGIAGRSDRVRGALVAAEVALALALVVVGGQLLASFAALLRTDPGFDAKHVTAFVVVPDAARYPTPEKWGTFYRRFGFGARTSWFRQRGNRRCFAVCGENTGGLVGKSAGGAPESGQIPAEIDVVSAGYLQTMGIRLLQGRWMNEEDMNNSSDAAIVSDLVAKRLWPGESAIGKPVCVFCSPEQPNNWKRVIGVVSSSRHASMEGPPQQASVYLASGALQKAVFWWSEVTGLTSTFKRPSAKSSPASIRTSPCSLAPRCNPSLMTLSPTDDL